MIRLHTITISVPNLLFQNNQNPQYFHVSLLKLSGVQPYLYSTTVRFTHFRCSPILYNIGGCWGFGNVDVNVFCVCGDVVMCVALVVVALQVVVVEVVWVVVLVMVVATVGMVVFVMVVVVLDNFISHLEPFK